MLDSAVDKLWLGIVLAIMLAGAGFVTWTEIDAASAAQTQSKPEVDVYTVQMVDGSEMKCAVATWYGDFTIDCDWSGLRQKKENDDS